MLPAQYQYKFYYHAGPKLESQHNSAVLDVLITEMGDADFLASLT